ncbi:VWA domain-containing protein [Phaeobacter sp. NW0010-22]|uniref:VWA domain-containing protein n=1 Tax=Phaeobacter sp. NW0010-22 TaxID=3135907 RepID=UPI0031089A75
MSYSIAMPWVLILLPLPWLVWRFLPPHRDQVAAIRVPFFRQITEAAGVEARAGAVVLRRKRIQVIAAIAVWVLVLVGLSRPERLGEPIVVETAARDVVLALDISGSMDDRDFKTADGSRQQRLEAVKSVIRSFIAERSGDRIALIIFGTRAYVQAPFTEDLQSLNGFLDQIVVGIAGPNTALGDAIGLGIQTFEASEVEKRLMILLSDGTDTSSRMTPINAAQIASDKGVVVYTVGVGDPDATGESRVDLATLKEIANRTGGQFFFADDETALTAVYSEIDKQNPRATETLSYRPKRSLTHLPFALALLIILGTVAGFTLSQRRNARARQ